MQIDDLAGNTVKITLEPSDMSGYHIKSEDISGHSHSAELALSRLISCLSEDHGLKLCGERLLVEAFPKSNGGCILYISCLKGTQKKYRQIIAQQRNSMYRIGKRACRFVQSIEKIIA